MKINFRLFAAFLLLGLLVGCTDPITVGSELLADDRATVGFDASIPLSATTVKNDSVRIFDVSSGARTSRYLFGSTQDDIFGLSQRGIYVIPRLLRNAASGLIQTPVFLNNDSITIDSIVLIITYDTSGFYGNAVGSTMDYRLFEVDQPYTEEEDFYSNDRLALVDPPLSEGSFKVTKTLRLVHDTLIIQDSVEAFHVRVPLPASIMSRIAAADSLAYETDQSFLDSVLAGVYLEPSSVSNGFISVNTQTIEASINIYFSSLDGSLQSFYPLDVDLGLATYEFDRSGSLAEQLLAQLPDTAAERTLSEGAGGLMTRIDLLDVSNLNGKFVNFAQLDLYLDESQGFDYDLFAAPPIVALYYRDADGRIQVIEDIEILPPGTSAANRAFFVGGDLEEDDDGEMLYRVNLSVHLQTIVDGENEPTIFVRVVPSEISPNRVILQGPGSADKPMVLKVAFTQF